MVGPLGRRTEHRPARAPGQAGATDRVGHLHAAVVQHVEAIDLRVLAHQALEDRVELRRRRAGDVTEDPVQDHVEATVLRLALVDLVDHVTLERAGQRLDAAGGALEAAVVEGGARAGAAEEESLQQIGAQLQRRHRLGLGLDPLRHHQRADPARKTDQALEGLLFVEVAVDAGDQASIDLNDVGAKQGDAIEIGVPGAHVVEDDQEAALPERRGQLPEPPDVVEARLEELHPDVARIEPGGADQRLQLGRQHRRLGHAGQIQVQEQQQLLGPRAQAVKVAHRALAAEILDRPGDPFGRRLLEQGVRRDQIAARSDAPGEGFEANHALPTNGEDRLEVRGDTPCFDQ